MGAQAAYVLVCVPAPDAGPAVAPCGSLNGVGYVPSVQPATLIDASLAAQIEASTGPFDYGLFTQYFGFAIGVMLSLFVLSYGVGLVMRTVRDA